MHDLIVQNDMVWRDDGGYRRIVSIVCECGWKKKYATTAVPFDIIQQDYTDHVDPGDHWEWIDGQWRQLVV